MIKNFLVGAKDPSVYLEADQSKFDASLIVIWLIAVVTVVLGSLWTLHEFRLMIETSRQQQQHDEAETAQQQQASRDSIDANKQSSSSDRLVNMSTVDAEVQSTPVNMPDVDSSSTNVTANKTNSTNADKNKDQHKHPITIHIGYVSVLVLLVIVVVMILLLYFFYNVMS